MNREKNPMGIKGIYGEIGQGQRVAFQKLSIDHYEQEDRPLRVAIDVSIWSFQVQAGQGTPLLVTSCRLSC